MKKKFGAGGGGGRAVKWSAIKTYIAKTLKAKAQCYHRSIVMIRPFNNPYCRYGNAIRESRQSVTFGWLLRNKFWDI